MESVYVESLGCPKNLTDSELILHHLSRKYRIESRYRKADIIIINTCGFIEPAKQESIGTILEYSRLTGKRVIVIGCLVNLYKKELKKEIPDIKEFYSSREFFREFLGLEYERDPDRSGFVSLTPRSYTFIKISDGCSRKCSYCTIPLIKGRAYSRPVSRIMDELKNKVKAGFREIVLIAQDLIRFGRENKEDLFRLLEEMERTEGEFRIRLLYLYPDKKIVDLVKHMGQSGKLVPY
ncbi:MAG: radical SAM protein, partial [bacterium]|nr:radical SAM protein [bacterium]